MITDERELQDLARQLFLRDVFSRQLQMDLKHISAGSATISMTITQDSSNAHQIWHGGAAFTFADMAFGCAALYGGPTLTIGSDFTFMSPGIVGDSVTAEAIQIARRNQTGIFQVTLASSTGEVLSVGVFKGRWTTR